MTISNKKAAKSLLETFKKHYKQVCKTEDLTTSDSLNKLDEYWIGKLISTEIKREIVRLVGKESLELKLIFNLMSSFRFPIPQKEWFLGDAHSTLLLPRQPCNSPVFTISTLRNGLLDLNTVMHFTKEVSTITATWNYEISDKCLKVYTSVAEKNFSIQAILNGDGKIAATNLYVDMPWLTPDEVNSLRPYHPRTELHWDGKTLNLTETGEIMTDGKKVVIFVNDRKVTSQKVLQIDIYKDVVVLLFDTWFMASGTIRESKTGFLIDCIEIAGSYPTEKFAISPNFTLIVRKSVFVEEIPETTVDFDFDNFKLNAETLEKMVNLYELWLSHEPNLEVEKSLGRAFEADRRLHLKNFCRDIQLFFKAIDKELPPEEYRLTPKEKLIILSQRDRDENFDCAVGTDKCCSNMRKFIAFTKEKQEILNADGNIDLYQKEALHLVTEMAGFFVTFYSKLIGRGTFSPEWLSDYQSTRYLWESHQTEFHRCFYFPLEIYERYHSPNSLGVEVDCASRSYFASNVLYIKCPKKTARIFFHRPDILFFGSTEIRLPIQLLKKFVEIYIKKGSVQDKEAIQKLSDELANWSGTTSEPQSMTLFQ